MNQSINKFKDILLIINYSNYLNWNIQKSYHFILFTYLS